MDKADVIRGLLILSGKLSKEDKKIGLVLHCVAESLKSGEDIFYAIDKLKDQLDIAQDMEKILT